MLKMCAASGVHIQLLLISYFIFKFAYWTKIECNFVVYFIICRGELNQWSH